MANYLQRRGARYWFRRDVPKELRGIIGKTAWTESLGTTDKDEAKRLCLRILATTYEVEKAARDKLAAGWKPPANRPTGNWDEHPSAAEIALEEARKASDEDAAAALPEAFFSDLHADKIADMEATLTQPLFAIPPEQAAVQLVVQRALETERERDWDEASRALVQYGGLAKALAKDGRGKAKPSGRETIMDLFEGYVAEVRPSRSTVDNWRPYMRKLGEFLGHDDPRKITTDDMQRWKDRLLKAPARNGMPLSNKTVGDGYMAAARTVFGWAKENRKLDSNPAADVRVRRQRRGDHEEQRGHTDAEAKLVLQAALANHEGGLSEETRSARRWIPWILAYSGARVGELAQLTPGNVVEQDGIWAIRVTAADGSVKSRKSRLIPLHSHLIDMEFLAFVKGRGGKPLFYDPGRSRKDTGRQYKKVGERLSTWLRSETGITDPTLDMNHGWRHRIKSASRLWGLNDEAIDVIQGHTPVTVGKRYGDFPLEALKREIEKIPRYEAD